MKRRTSSDELKIVIEGKVLTVRVAKFRLRMHIIRSNRLARAIKKAKAIENPKPDQVKDLDNLLRKERLNKERIKAYKDPLDAAQFHQYVATIN